MSVLNCDLDLRSSARTIIDSRRELAALRATLRITQDVVNESRACIAASIALKVEADRILEKAGRLFAGFRP